MNISINTPKTTSRGVQEADVWAAADALIAQGLRPTIERVRQHIGRGLGRKLFADSNGHGHLHYDSS